MSDTIRRNGRSKCWITSNDNRQNIINQRKLSVTRTCIEWPLTYETEHKTFERMKGICKALRVKERQLRNKRRKPRKPGKPVWFRVDPDDPRVLILCNGKRLRQKEGLDLFCSMDGDVYSLTKYGLRKRRVNFTRKRRYGMKSCNGVYNGRRYPYITFRGETYPLHILMMEIWVRPRREGEEIDHLDGNIDNFRLENLELVTREENNRRKVILQALRRAAHDLHDPRLDPVNRSSQEMAEIYSSITVDDPKKMMEYEMTQHMERCS